MLKLTEICKDITIRGVIPNHSVTVISVNSVGDNAVSIVYRNVSGGFGEQMLFPDDESRLELVTEGRPWSFDGNGNDFKLGAEAYRIRLAHLFDPLMAIHTSDIEPLPHQITAVYDTMLTRQPLRFVLADDPGAGKTIMAGLLIRELMIRGDVKRCLIVAPGSLAEQWQDEMGEKFGLSFNIFSRDMIENSRSGNPFEGHDLLICRLDQFSRNEELRAKLEQTAWDIVIVDEAHKMSASFSGQKINMTKRYHFGELLRKTTRHFLLMTATPHNGKEEDFQLFMSLLDADRFYGRFRDGVHKADTSDIMRRMVKEDLLKFDGTPLFPKRFAYTAQYDLSAQEKNLYDAVTRYVREEMNRAENLEKGRKGTVGFALTILQRRLASSPEAIYQSLKRRRKRLEQKLADAKRHKQSMSELGGLPEMTEEDIDDFIEDAKDNEIHAFENNLADQATAARNIPELEKEIEILKILEQEAKAVRLSEQDKKWEELSRLLQETPEMKNEFGQFRKLIIFTEHRDTLNYLADRLKGVLGNDEAVVVIHGGVKREKRREIQEAFTQNKDVTIMVATDAAGEGINLQRANLLINYDLPWNPNRIEQRFGRIHRIGQTEVCHLWNLVAKDTCEGQVFQQLFTKLESQRKALGDRVFDILGEIFNDYSLKDLLIQAIRFGEDPKIRTELYQKVEGVLNTEYLRSILEQNALATEHIDLSKLYSVKEEMEKAQARKLQPHFIKTFLKEAFVRMGTTLKEREPGRFEITYVPSAIRNQGKLSCPGQPVLKKYERICFEKDKIRPLGKTPAAIVCPGHPLMDATLDWILGQYRELLRQGTVLINPADEGTEPHVMLFIEHIIRDGGKDKAGEQRIISRRVQFVNADRNKQVTQAGYAPYLDYYPADTETISQMKDLFDEDWLNRELENIAISYAADYLVPEHISEVRTRRQQMVDKTLKAVHERLTKEIAFWSKRYFQLKQEVSEGKQPEIQPENARRNVEELTERLGQRKAELESQRHVVSNTPMVIGGALIIPQGLIDQKNGKTPVWAQNADARTRVEKLAMKAVMDKEIAEGYAVEDVSARHCGWDITAKDDKGNIRFIEVKGRIKTAITVTITKNEIFTCLNQPDKYILAIVLIEGDNIEGLYYIPTPFSQEPDFGVTSINYDLSELIGRAV